MSAPSLSRESKAILLRMVRSVIENLHQVLDRATDATVINATFEKLGPLDEAEDELCKFIAREDQSDPSPTPA